MTQLQVLLFPSPVKIRNIAPDSSRLLHFLSCHSRLLAADSAEIHGQNFIRQSFILQIQYQKESKISPINTQFLNQAVRTGCRK